MFPVDPNDLISLDDKYSSKYSIGKSGKSVIYVEVLSISCLLCELLALSTSSSQCCTKKEIHCRTELIHKTLYNYIIVMKMFKYLRDITLLIDQSFAILDLLLTTFIIWATILQSLKLLQCCLVIS